MKKNKLFFILLLVNSVVFGQKATDNFIGKWKTQEGRIIEITQKDNVFTGKSVQKGLIVLKDLKFEENKWVGIISNPLKNISANCEAFLEGNQIRFIAKKGPFSKEILWLKEK